MIVILESKNKQTIYILQNNSTLQKSYTNKQNINKKYQNLIHSKYSMNKKN